MDISHPEKIVKISEIRKKFKEFYASKGHENRPSSSLVPLDDPTLLFNNAGMNQFKDYFTGKATPQTRRVTTVQKCVRAGGKHNDLDNVGFTSRHHTYFEMLGNFSFGDYFKKEAIAYAWEFLTQVLGLPKEKLYITVHYTDDEAEKIWNEQEGVPLDRIFRKGDKDNFWEMGEYGPCGPSSEIFYDWGEENKDPSINNPECLLDDEMRYVEIWNLVFMQFEKDKSGTHPLPNPSIDTGMGLERLAGVLQGKYWNYDIETFQVLIKKIEELSGAKYSNPKSAPSMRVVSDHIRSATMLITDGVIPSNEGRGYVLRRIIRRAVRHFKELGVTKPCLSQLVPLVFDQLGEEYPENKANAELAIKFLDLEEKRFLETLDTGLKFLDEAIKQELKGDTLPGVVAFKLYDTYGFPPDLTEIILQERNLNLDKEGFDHAMEKQKELSRASWKGGHDTNTEKLYYELKEKHGGTEFLGYSQLSSESQCLANIDLGEGRRALLFKSTPFYAESGGQVGDRGMVLSEDKVVAKVVDVQKPVEDLFVHICLDADGVTENKTYDLQVDKDFRELTKRNHSATHLLQAALIQTLGDHIKQAGSLVNSKKLRFDFTHPEGLKKDELDKVQALVNEQITKEVAVQTDVTDKDTAIKKGAKAFFGEKYGDTVRVLSMGDFSVELCGGTHVSNTKEIQHFQILSEGSLSAGVRRIEAITSEEAEKFYAEKAGYFDRLLSLLPFLKKGRLEVHDKAAIILNLEKKTSYKGPDFIKYVDGLISQLNELRDSIPALEQKANEKFSGSLKLEDILSNSSIEMAPQDLADHLKSLNKENQRLQDIIQSKEANTLFDSTEKIGQYDYKFIITPAGSNLKKLSDEFVKKVPNGVLVMGTENKGKLSLLVRKQKSIEPLNCKDVLQSILQDLNGRGGGKPDMAQGSGDFPSDIGSFEDNCKNIITKSLS